MMIIDEPEYKLMDGIILKVLAHDGQVIWEQIVPVPGHDSIRFRADEPPVIVGRPIAYREAAYR